MRIQIRKADLVANQINQGAVLNVFFRLGNRHVLEILFDVSLSKRVSRVTVHAQFNFDGISACQRSYELIVALKTYIRDVPTPHSHRM